MEFITELTKECENAKYLINDFIKSVLTLDISAPFASDTEYLELMEAHYMMSILTLDGNNNISDVLGVPQPKDKPLNFEDTQKMVESIRKVKAKIEEIKEVKLKVMGRKPRIIRWAEKLKATPKEALILHYILLSHVGSKIRGLKIRESQDPVHLGLHAKMSITELLEFVKPQRLYIKQGIFEYFDTTHALQNNMTLKQEIILALVGQDLTGEQTLKIDNTALSEVLDEEKDPEELKKKKELEKKAREEEKIKKEQEMTKNVPDFEDEADLYNFISQQVIAEKTKPDDLLEPKDETEIQMENQEPIELDKGEIEVKEETKIEQEKTDLEKEKEKEEKIKSLLFNSNCVCNVNWNNTSSNKSGSYLMMNNFF
eukprot:Anaeramoba_ignava/a478674_2347.p2 GENE.a478674_2347~~a478674_2347.p2  ORF type:complete len:371 (-),score=157.34 a478674_2347:7346-8458(-)